MGYRTPTREPARAAAAAERELDAHVDAARSAREALARRGRFATLARVTMYILTFVIAVVGFELDSAALKLTALGLFLLSLFWALARLMLRIPPRDGGRGGLPPGAGSL